MLLAIFFFRPCAAVILATTVVIIRFNDEIIIAADSEGTIYDKGIKTRQNVCKIFSAANLHFAVTGFTLNANSKFDAAQVAREHIRQELTIEQNADAVAKVLQERLPQEFEWVQATYPNSIKPEVSAGAEAFSTIVFVGMRNGTAVFTARMFHVETSKTAKPQIKVRSFTCPGDCSGASYTAYFGSHTNIYEFMAERKRTGNTRMGSAIDGARQLVQLEIDAKTPGVGGHVDILLVNKAGPEWINRKPECK